MAKPKSAGALEEDRMLVEQIRRAEYFTAFLLHGAHDRRKRDNLATYADAVVAAEELNAGATNTRRAIIYAVVGRVGHPVSPELAQMAGLV